MEFTLNVYIYIYTRNIQDLSMRTSNEDLQSQVIWGKLNYCLSSFSSSFQHLSMIVHLIIKNFMFNNQKMFIVLTLCWSGNCFNRRLSLLAYHNQSIFWFSTYGCINNNYIYIYFFTDMIYYGILHIFHVVQLFSYVFPEILNIGRMDFSHLPDN